MRRLTSLLLFSALLVVVAACESSTDLDEVTLVGRWDGVGSLQTSDQGRELQVRIQSDANGMIGGTWKRTQASTISGTVVGTVTGDDIEFTLLGFPTTVNPTFLGGLTNEHRMSGSFTPSLTDGGAVFRRGSLDP